MIPLSYDSDMTQIEGTIFKENIVMLKLVSQYTLSFFDVSHVSNVPKCQNDE